ncbi:MAG: carbamoyl phosphate synthase small subunit [Clostridia bacterium]|nr:carbamoyl phosphate synthase small subunit [Clostridia bacterium]
MKGYLVLENGSVYEGERIGANKDIICEVVFNTSMTGYLEIFTDPSYAGQGVVMTYPLIGNYGLTKEDQESKKPWVEAVFVHEIAEMESNFRSKMHILDFLKEYDVPGLEGINTRKLTKELRNAGTMKGKLTSDISNIDEIIREIKEFKISNLVERVSSKEVYTCGSGKTKIALFDFGAKQNIINSLLNRDCEVTVFPYDTSYKEFLTGEYEGIVLSNGPGNPEDCKISIENIKKLYEEANVPILGICLGHQLMGLATGAKTYKLKYGHRGPNHPVKDLSTGRVCITSQNHGYAIDDSSINPNIAEISHVNINDGTVEGLRYKGHDIVTVQYHPEACPGPEDSSYLFDEFIAKIKK